MPQRRLTLEQRLAAAREPAPKRRAKKGTGSVWREDDRWRGEWTHPETKVKYRPTGTSEAIVWAKIEALKTGGDPRKAVVAETTLVGYCQKWVAAGIGARGAKVKETYSIRLEEQLRLHVAPYFGDTPLSDVTPRMVADFIADRRAAGYPNGTLAGMRNLLSGALGAARTDGLIRDNPAMGHRIGQAGSGFNVPGASREMGRHVIAAVHLTPFSDLIQLLLYEPARIGELIRLDWRYVHFEKHEMTIFATETRLRADPDSGHLSKRGTGSPKSMAGRRDIPMPEEALHLLRGRHIEMGEPRSGLVFPSKTDPARPISPRWVLKEFAALMVAADIPLTKLHQLRHLGLSLLIQSGVPIPIVSKIAGHANPAITARLYAHVLGGAEHDAIQHLRFFPPPRLSFDETVAAIDAAPLTGFPTREQFESWMAQYREDGLLDDDNPQ
jgi:integrase